MFQGLLNESLELRDILDMIASIRNFCPDSPFLGMCLEIAHVKESKSYLCPCMRQLQRKVMAVQVTYN